MLNITILLYREHIKTNLDHLDHPWRMHHTLQQIPIGIRVAEGSTDSDGCFGMVCEKQDNFLEVLSIRTSRTI
jgi:hypothetical protein